MIQDMNYKSFGTNGYLKNDITHQTLDDQIDDAFYINQHVIQCFVLWTSFQLSKHH